MSLTILIIWNGVLYVHYELWYNKGELNTTEPFEYFIGYNRPEPESVSD